MMIKFVYKLCLKTWMVVWMDSLDAATISLEWPTVLKRVPPTTFWRLLSADCAKTKFIGKQILLKLINGCRAARLMDWKDLGWSVECVELGTRSIISFAHQKAIIRL